MLDKVNVARRNGSARKTFIERVGGLMSEYDQGRGATACLADIKEAYLKLGKTTRNRNGEDAR